jgi:hypothetical protein
MLMLPLLFAVGCVLLGAVVALFVVVNGGESLKRFRRSSAELLECPLRVRWQGGRWDSDVRHAYVANLGDDTAYEVSVVEHQQIIAASPSVPPFSADRLSSASGPPCYLNFCVHTAVNSGIPTGSAGATYRARAYSGETDRVAVQVRWRTELGEWCTQDVRIT